MAILLVGCALMWCDASCSQPVGSSAESTAHKGQAIGNGTLDTGNAYPMAAALVTANCDSSGLNCESPRRGQVAECSAVLLTPVLVASAGHCFHDADKKAPFTPDSNFWVVFNNDLVDYPLDHAFLHSEHRSGAVQVMPNDWGSAKDQPYHDIALFTLDKRVPSDIAHPLHPAGILGQPGCLEAGHAFRGADVGYGHLSLCAVTPDFLCFSNVDDSDALSYRSFAVSDGWHFESNKDDSGGDFRRDWTIALPEAADLESLYQGDLPGDSGGPLIRVDAGAPRLCGVASRVDFTSVEKPIPLPPFVTYLADEYARYAALDHGENRKFIEKRAEVTIDGQQTWLGECPPGDGPEDLRDVDSDGDYIPDACDPCPYVYDKQFHDTGVMTPYADRDWNPNTGDFTGDGVPDICDSCPGAGFNINNYNPRIIINGQRIQPDSDVDGLGDACDKCNHSDVRGIGDHVCCAGKGDDKPCGNPGHSPYRSLCVPQGQIDSDPADTCDTGFACSQGKDSDGDGVQDTCDNCISKMNSAQKDTDHDGVGDACDNCNGRHPQDPKLGGDNDKTFAPADQNLATCTDNADCVAKTGNANSKCEPGQYYVDPSTSQPGIKPRHCSKLKDSDGDGLGDACDNCVHMPNKAQHNCNKLIEEARGVPYPYLGDACDLNPCGWLSSLSLAVPDFQIDDPGYRDLWLSFHDHPAMLPKSIYVCSSYLSHTSQCFTYPVSTNPAESEPPFQNAYSGTPHATIGHRICRCPSAGSLASVKQCERNHGCARDATQYSNSASPWNQDPPALVPTPANNLLPKHPTSGFQSEFAGRTMELPRDLVLGKLPAYNLEPTGTAPTKLSWDLTANGAHALYGGVTEAYGLDVVLWTAVRDVPEMVYHDASVSTFQTWSNSYFADSFGVHKSNAGPGQVKLLCPAGNCGDDCKTCRYWVDAFNLITLPPEQRIMAQGLMGTVDVTSQFSEQAATLLTSPDLTWIEAAEGSGWIQPDSVSLASVSTDGTRVLAAMARVEAGGPIQVVGGDLGVLRDAAQPISTQLAMAPPARSDFGVVLSATEGSVFVIGGTLSSGKTAGDLWRYDVGSSSWQQLHLTGPAPENVLAATFVPGTRSLYWLDERVIGTHQARLVRCDLDTQRTTLLGAWPRTPQVDRVYLTSNSDGLLVLAGGSSILKYVAGVVLEPRPHGVSIAAGFYRKGLPVFAPVLTEEALTLALAGPTPSAVRHEVIPVPQLFSEAKPKKGNGKAWGKQSQLIDIGHVL